MANNKRDKEEKLQEKSFPKVHVNWYPGHMAKTKKQIAEDVKLVDVVIEVLDARMPYASQNRDVEEMIKGKKRIFILNKSDLADEQETKKWKNFFEQEKQIITVIVNSNNGMRYG